MLSVSASLRRCFSTLNVRRKLGHESARQVSVTSADDLPLLCLSGFTGQYLPSKEDFHVILRNSIRPKVLSNGAFEHMALPDNPDKIFKDFQSYRTSTSEGQVIFRLLDKDIMNQLPISRDLATSSLKSNDHVMRTSWCAVLLPVLNGRMHMLTREGRQALKVTRQWHNMRWYSLVYRTFNPNRLYLEDMSSTRAVATLLKEMDAGYVLDQKFENEEDAEVKEEEEGFTLRFDSMSELLDVRQRLMAKGVATSLEQRVEYNDLQEFNRSEYRRTSFQSIRQENSEIDLQPLRIGLRTEASAKLSDSDDVLARVIALADSLDKLENEEERIRTFQLASAKKQENMVAPRSQNSNAELMAMLEFEDDANVAITVPAQEIESSEYVEEEEDEEDYYSVERVPAYASFQSSLSSSEERSYA